MALMSGHTIGSIYDDVISQEDKVNDGLHILSQIGLW